MASYAVVDWVSSVSDPKTVAAEVEVKLETLDSTTNTIVMSSVIPIGSDNCQAMIIYSG